MRVVRLLLVVAIFGIAVFEMGCGEDFRPIAIPINPQPPDPKTTHFELVLTANGPQVCLPTTPPTAPPPAPPNTPCDPSPHFGSSNRIDVSGDTNVGSQTVGMGPVHAVLLPPNGDFAYVANSLDNTVTSYITSTLVAGTTITLPPGSIPSFVETTEAGKVYVANVGNSTVSVISTGPGVVSKTIPHSSTNGIGNNPIAMVETPDSKKLYVVNQGDGTVTAVNTVDDSVNAVLTVGNSPIWAVARADSARAYVLNQGSGTVSEIDTASDTVLNPLSPIAVGQANYMFYDKALNRLYLTVPSTAQLAVVNVAANPPVVMPNVDLSGACPAGCVLDSVTALPDGSKVYVSSHAISATCTQLAGAPLDSPPCITTQVSVIRTPNNTVQGTITSTHTVFVNSQSIGSKPDVPVVPFCDTIRFRRHIASAAVDGSKVYVANCDAGGIDIIRTADDSFIVDVTAPASAAPPSSGQAFPPPQNPVFVLSDGRK